MTNTDKEIKDMLATVESQLYYKMIHEDCNNADVVRAHEAAKVALEAFATAVRKASVSEHEKAKARRVMSHPTIEEAHKDCKGCCATCRFAEDLDGDVAEALGIDRIKNAHTTYCIAP